MVDFRDIEVKAGNQSFILTVIIGLLSLLVLFISFSFDHVKPLAQPIEIAMNFGNTPTGEGLEEPAITEQSSTPSNSSSQPVSQPTEPTTTQEATQKSVTQNTSERIPVASNKKTSDKKAVKATPKASESKPQGDQRANDALSNILGAKGKNSSSGQGNDGSVGNVGDPKGSDSHGTGVGENWKSTIPEPQHHNCSASGTIMVEVIVNASGGIKSVTPGVKGSTTADECLKTRARELVLKYVRAYPGSDGRKGIYRVNLR
ncbi:MAG: hypothetical protein ACR2MS_03505 [Weeksellaceae bacterium]